MKQALKFPAAPESNPATANPELTHFLRILKVFDACLAGVQAATEAAPTLAALKAAERAQHWIMKGAREAIDDLGPLSSAAQKLELGKFTSELEQNRSNQKEILPNLNEIP